MPPGENIVPSNQGCCFGQRTTRPGGKGGRFGTRSPGGSSRRTAAETRPREARNAAPGGLPGSGEGSGRIGNGAASLAPSVSDTNSQHAGWAARSFLLRAPWMWRRHPATRDGRQEPAHFAPEVCKRTKASMASPEPHSLRQTGEWKTNQVGATAHTQRITGTPSTSPRWPSSRNTSNSTGKRC